MDIIPHALKLCNTHFTIPEDCDIMPTSMRMEPKGSPRGRNGHGDFLCL